MGFVETNPAKLVAKIKRPEELSQTANTLAQTTLAPYDQNQTATHTQDAQLQNPQEFEIGRDQSLIRDPANQTATPEPKQNSQKPGPKSRPGSNKPNPGPKPRPQKPVDEPKRPGPPFDPDNPDPYRGPKRYR